MARQVEHGISRRSFLRASATVAVGLSFAPYLNCGKVGVKKPMKRSFGGLDFEVTTLGLGGQASVQWTPSDVDPVQIILKAFKLGINYFDTSNLYGPSQSNFGKAFNELDLIPGQPGYDEGKRRSIFLTSKTGLRYAKGGFGQEGLFNYTNGPEGSGAIDDLKRTLSQIFGDGRGDYPRGAYVDMMLMHNITSMRDVDAAYEGFDEPDPSAERIGAFAALLDYRDGTNRTGLNPKEEQLIRHIGFSGHHSPPVQMEMLQRDEHGQLGGMLVAINANDRLNFNMQHNAIPVATAKNMGIIAMKVFADGAMYTKEPVWSRAPEHVVRTVGDPKLPSRPLIEYSLTTPGISTAIIGIGQIDDEPAQCQLEQNLSAAQIRPDGLGESGRQDVEEMASSIKDGKTNYFQIPIEPLSPPREPAVSQQMRDDQRIARLTWQTAYAGKAPIQQYDIWRDGDKIAQVQHQPQTTKKPFAFEDKLSDQNAHAYKLVTVDATGGTAATEKLELQAIS
ncbi:MAG: aldo/keto reductase [Fidelibacterota bacterium]|nr:MAG: aldo/keto reductase [Candidatus Neomarinimicrobiota bacterium]